MALEVQIKRCCVLNCSTQRTGKNDVSRIAMHKLPPASSDEPGSSQKSLRARWLFLAGRAEKDITAENEYVCGKHFMLSAYHHLSSDNKKLRKLDPKAVPSVLLPLNKENAASKNIPNRSLTEATSSSKESPCMEEKEMNCPILPSNGTDEIVPVLASVDLLNPNSRDSAAPEPSNSDSKDSSNSRTKLEKNQVKKIDKLEVRLAPSGDSNVQRKSSTESESGSKTNGLSKKKLNESESIEISLAAGDDSNEKSNSSTSTDSTENKSSAKTAPTAQATEENPVASTSQTNRQSKVNGSTEVPKSNGTAPSGLASAPASKRRYCEDSDGEASSEAPRKRPNEEQKSQARMKIRPRRSDLQTDAGAISRPDVVAGANNKHAYLKGFTEALLNAAVYQLKKAFDTQNTQLTNIFQQLSVDAEDIERKYEDVTCRINTCKRPWSTRSVGVQITTLPAALPTMVAETPKQSAPVPNVNKPTPIPLAQQPTAALVKPPARRGRPPNSVRLMAAAQAPKVTAISEPMIDLTDDEPSVSVIRAPQSAARTTLGSKPDTNAPGPASKGPASYSRAAPQMPVKIPSSISVTKPAQVSLLKPDLSPTKPAPRTFAVKSSGLANRPATSKLIAASATTRPVPVGSIFPGQQLPSKPVVAQNNSVVSQTSSQSQSPSKPGVVGNIRLPPDIEMMPVANGSGGSQANPTTKNDSQEQQKRQPKDEQLTPQKPQTAPQPASQLPRTKPRTSLPRVRHPAPLPETPSYNDTNELLTPPAPLINVTAGENGIVLTWDMRMQANLKYSPAEKYQIFTYTEGEQPPSTDLWRMIGTINALQLPMAVTLCAYKPGYRYYFAVRGVDQLNRYGAFNEPKAVDLRESIVL